MFWDGDRSVIVHSDCQVVRNVEVGELLYWKESGADQNVTTTVGRKVDMLCKVEAL